jgi:peroxiredoxin Q/BCP
MAKKKAAKKKTAKSLPKRAGKKTSGSGAGKAGRKTAGKKASGRKVAKKATVAKKKTAAKKKTSRRATPLVAKEATQAVQTLLQVGQDAPDFELQNENGETVRLSDYHGKKVVLYFYPKDDTPGCTQESCDFRDNYGRVKSVGAEVFGISKDDVNSHTKFKNKYSLPFSLLADPEGKVVESFGVWKEKSMYGRKYMGIERTTFLVDTDGKIKKIYPKVSVTGHVDQVLEDLK